MVLPVTGPFDTAIVRSDIYRRQTAWRQVKPFTLALPYRLQQCRFTGGYGAWASPPQAEYAASRTYQYHANTENPLLIDAYAKMKDKLYQTAGWGVNLATFSQAYGMVAARTLQLVGFAEAVRRGNFKLAAKILEMPKPPRGVKASRSAASNYLEFHFGWSPVMADIWNSVEILQGAPKMTLVKGQSRNSQVTVINRNPAPSSTRIDVKRESFVQYGVRVKVTNPNLFLANQLGLVNPAVVAADLVPFSFVLDWFVNLNDFLSYSTDFLGLELDESSYTTVVHHMTYGEYFRGEAPWSTDTQHKYAYVWMERKNGVTKPSFGFRKAKVWGLRRALAACSLLAVKLKSF